MTRAQRGAGGGVDWHLPGDKRKRPFATTTLATSDLVVALARDGLTWSEVHAAINFDSDAKAVAAQFVSAGHGDTPARDHVTNATHAVVPLSVALDLIDRAQALAEALICCECGKPVTQILERKRS